MCGNNAMLLPDGIALLLALLLGTSMCKGKPLLEDRFFFNQIFKNYEWSLLADDLYNQ